MATLLPMSLRCADAQCAADETMKDYETRSLCSAAQWLQRHASALVAAVQLQGADELGASGASRVTVITHDPALKVCSFVMKSGCHAGYRLYIVALGSLEAWAYEFTCRPAPQVVRSQTRAEDLGLKVQTMHEYLESVKDEFPNSGEQLAQLVDIRYATPLFAVLLALCSRFLQTSSFVLGGRHKYLTSWMQCIIMRLRVTKTRESWTQVVVLQSMILTGQSSASLKGSRAAPFFKANCGWSLTAVGGASFLRQVNSWALAFLAFLEQSR